MDAVTIDAMVVEAVRAERERIKERLQMAIARIPWLPRDLAEQELLQCVEEG